MQKDGIWHEHFRIRADEMDRFGRLSPLALFNYLQEAAGRHAHNLGVGVHQLLEKKQNWMLSRFFMQIETYPRYGDEITVQTWPCGVDRFFALRDFLILDHKHHIAGRAASGWLLIDLESRRILRLEQLLEHCTVAKRALNKDLKKLPQPLIHEIQKEYTVRLNDIDVNQHANSVAFLEWILEAIPLSTQNSQLLSSIEINYQSEAKYDEKITSSTHIDDTVQNTWLHSIQKKQSGEELARARTSWKIV
jgi:medium-chain acyl-[acyl-carrier-protein] hydrolase